MGGTDRNGLDCSGFTQLTFSKNGVARGMYTITLQNNDNVMSRRIVLM